MYDSVSVPFTPQHLLNHMTPQQVENNLGMLGQPSQSSIIHSMNRSSTLQAAGVMNPFRQLHTMSGQGYPPSTVGQFAVNPSTRVDSYQALQSMQQLSGVQGLQQLPLQRFVRTNLGESNTFQSPIPSVFPSSKKAYSGVPLSQSQSHSNSRHSYRYESKASEQRVVNDTEGRAVVCVNKYGSIRSPMKEVGSRSEEVWKLLSSVTAEESPSNLNQKEGQQPTKRDTSYDTAVKLNQLKTVSSTLPHTKHFQRKSISQGVSNTVHGAGSSNSLNSNMLQKEENALSPGGQSHRTSNSVKLLMTLFGGNRLKENNSSSNKIANTESTNVAVNENNNFQTLSPQTETLYSNDATRSPHSTPSKINQMNNREEKQPWTNLEQVFLVGSVSEFFFSAGQFLLEVASNDARTANWSAVKELYDTAWIKFTQSPGVFGEMNFAGMQRSSHPERSVEDMAAQYKLLVNKVQGTPQGLSTYYALWNTSYNVNNHLIGAKPDSQLVQLVATRLMQSLQSAGSFSGSMGGAGPTAGEPTNALSSSTNLLRNGLFQQKATGNQLVQGEWLFVENCVLVTAVVETFYSKGYLDFPSHLSATSQTEGVLESRCSTWPLVKNNFDKLMNSLLQAFGQIPKPLPSSTELFSKYVEVKQTLQRPSENLRPYYEACKKVLALVRPATAMPAQVVQQPQSQNMNGVLTMSPNFLGMVAGMSPMQTTMPPALSTSMFPSPSMNTFPTAGFPGFSGNAHQMNGHVQLQSKPMDYSLQRLNELLHQQLLQQQQQQQMHHQSQNILCQNAENGNGRLNALNKAAHFQSSHPQLSRSSSSSSQQSIKRRRPIEARGRKTSNLSEGTRSSASSGDKRRRQGGAELPVGKQRRNKWTEDDLLILWENIEKYGNEWQKVKEKLTGRTYHQVKDKGKRMLHEQGWETGRSKIHNDIACEKAKIIATRMLGTLKPSSRN